MPRHVTIELTFGKIPIPTNIEDTILYHLADDIHYVSYLPVINGINRMQVRIETDEFLEQCLEESPLKLFCKILPDTEQWT